MNATRPTPSPSTEPARPTTMTGLLARRYGGPEVLEVGSVPVPDPGPGEVLVAVAVAGASRGALHLLTGEPYLLRLAGFGLRAPKQPVVGNEVAGVVAAVGSDATGFAPGTSRARGFPVVLSFVF